MKQHNTTTIHSMSMPYDNGDLNPDPFYLTIEEAKQFANYFGDIKLLKEVRDAVWEGETMVPIDQKYARIWEEFKQLKV